MINILGGSLLLKMFTEAKSSVPYWDYFALLNLISEDFQNIVHEIAFLLSSCSMSSFVTDNFF